MNCKSGIKMRILTPTIKRRNVTQSLDLNNLEEKFKVQRFHQAAHFPETNCRNLRGDGGTRLVGWRCSKRTRVFINPVCPLSEHCSLLFYVHVFWTTGRRRFLLLSVRFLIPCILDSNSNKGPFLHSPVNPKSLVLSGRYLIGCWFLLRCLL